jgi:hypothetical protein
MEGTSRQETKVRRTMRRHIERAHCDERGEGVISAAIAVLIMAFLGAAMWVGFNAIWDDAEDNTRTQVQQIGDADE